MKIKWVVLVALTLLCIALPTIYIKYFLVVPSDSTRGAAVTTFIFLSITAWGVLSSFLLSSFNSLEATLNIKDRIKFDMTENSFNYMTRWDSPSLKEARDETRRIKKIKDDVSSNQLLKEIKEDEALERSIITMFNFFEEIYLSSKSKRINEAILREAFSTLYIDIHNRFQVWINANLETTQKRNLENLFNMWKPT